MTDASGAADELAIQDRVLVEAEIFGRTVPFRTVIVKVCADELWLGLASPDKRLESLCPNQVLKLTVARSGGALLGQSGFLRPLGGSKSRVFAVVRPGALEKVQRRAHIRYQLDLPIHFRHIDPATREPRGKAAGGMTANVSPAGILFQSEIPLTVGEELAVTLPLVGGDRVDLLGVVTRVREAQEGAVGPNGGAGETEVAVKFTRVTAVDQDRIVRFILLTEHRRREAALRQPPPEVPAAFPQPAVAVAPPAAPARVPVPAAVAATMVPAVPRAEASTPQPRPQGAPVTAVAFPAAPAPDLPTPSPDQPLIEFALHLCEDRETKDVRLWFDSLMPGSRIELLTMLQTNIAGGSVPGAREPGSARPLALALGLLAA